MSAVPLPGLKPACSSGSSISIFLTVGTYIIYKFIPRGVLHSYVIVTLGEAGTGCEPVEMYFGAVDASLVTISKCIDLIKSKDGVQVILNRKLSSLLCPVQLIIY